MSLAILLALLSSSLWARAPKYCEVQGQAPQQVFKIDKKPDYFFKASADGKFIYYIAGGKNHALNTETLTETELPGIADPVPSPDGKLFSYLEKGWVLHLGAMENGNQINSVYTDREVRPYQSIGKFGETYQVFSQSAGTNNRAIWNYRNYSWTRGRITSTSDSTQVPDSDHLRLPMINKTGKFLIAFNNNTSKSEILSVESGKVVETLPVGGGKSDFSYDDKKITFHLTVNPSEDTKWREHNFGNIQNQTTVRNIFVYDRPSKKLKQVTNFTSGSAFFPVFLGNGQIIYLFKTPNGTFEFHKVNEPAESIRSRVVVENCLGEETTQSTIDSLVEKWFETCDEWNGSADRTIAELAIMNLSKEYCLTLGKSAKVSKETMKQFCDPKIESNQKESDITNSPAQVLFNNKCVVCHTDDIPFNNPTELVKWKSKIEERLISTDPAFRMPRGGTLEASERDTLIEYVQQLKKSK